MSTARKLATYDDLLADPSEAKTEIFDGEIHVQPSPLAGHGRAQLALGRFIGGPFDGDRRGPGGWWILAEMDVRFDVHNVVRPDVVGWRRSRLPDPWNSRPIDVVPDWICEVLSPSTAKIDRVRKRQLYARHGVPHYWLVDPIDRVLEAFVLDGAEWRLAGTYDDTDIARIPPFEAIEIPLEELFPPLPPPPA
ncbi:Uma2 family endonuclease [Nannocystis bainbridge]|uniref:Uma2 family endonuclease n=1 Tax=Nannocystis bainbridge TaxID=2995303 RepID=A0ABT5E6T1_9BACT|nr:Uma2 family endonuclease [Nannocystis bainbridge]MDC0721571.1 Uma2 family endonuclease [Nannocystis bainbridge]